MQKWNGSLLRKFDNAIDGNASVGTTVVVRNTVGNTIAVVYDVDDTNSVQKNNPFVTDDFGRYSFFAPNGKYTIEFGDGSDDIEIVLVDNFDLSGYNHNDFGGRDDVGAHDNTYIRKYTSFSDMAADKTELAVGSLVSIGGVDFEISATEGVFLDTGKYLNTLKNYDVSGLNAYKDTVTDERYRTATDVRDLNVTDAFRDIMDRSWSGVAPKITCYGDSNTRYFEGGIGAGPFSKSYGAYLDLFCAEYPFLYASTIGIQGNPNEESSFGVAQFDTQVPSDSNVVVLGWGTNNVKLINANMVSYINDMETLIQNTLALNAMPIVLGIPYFTLDYGSEGVVSQGRVKTWNATLYALCMDYNIPFIDTYNLTRQFSSIYMNEPTTRRHYAPQATKQIAQKIIDVLKTYMASSGDSVGMTLKTFGDYSSFTSITGAVARTVYENGGIKFETLTMQNGSSVTLRGRGRGCVAFYPRAAGGVDINTGLQSQSVVITPVIDNGKEFYNVQRVSLSFVHFGQDYPLTISVTSGSAYIRVISFEDGHSNVNIYNKSYEQVAVASLPSTGVRGRDYIVNELEKAIRWSFTSNVWVGSDGLTTVGTTTQRDAVATAGCPNGYKFYNTTVSAVQRYSTSTGLWS